MPRPGQESISTCALAHRHGARRAQSLAGKIWEPDAQRVKQWSSPSVIDLQSGTPQLVKLGYNML